jgi:hypothetical protein
LRDIGSAGMGLALIVNFAWAGALGIQGFYEEQIVPRLQSRARTEDDL